MAGALMGLRVIEMAGIGPGPFCAMMLADMGAEIIRVEKPGGDAFKDPVTTRGRSALVLDLKQSQNLDYLLNLIQTADVLLEGYRPGVMEKMGLGPEVCLALNPRLVYGRMTGWGQYGPLAQTAGHDINYISITGALHAVGRKNEAPVPPLNYVGDFGGGAMMLLAGILAALYERERSHLGQVIDAAMTDGSAMLSALMYGMRSQGQWSTDRGQNMLDSGAHFYNVYACSDHRYVAVGAIEPQFYQQFCEVLGVDGFNLQEQMDSSCWDVLKEKIATVFRTKTQTQWIELFQGTDACVSPVLDWDEAVYFSHNQERETYQVIDQVVHPSPAPRLSRTPSSIMPGIEAAMLATRWLSH